VTLELKLHSIRAEMALKYLEYGLGSLLFQAKGHDEKLFTKGPAFASSPKPTIEITSLDCGPSESNLKKVHSQFGENRFPELEWSPPAGTEIQEYLLVVEDPDAPLPIAPCHGLFYGIPGSTRHIPAQHIALDESDEKKRTLKGGFKLGKNMRGSVYGGPRPPLGHGSHRYFYQLIGLKERLDQSKMSEKATKKELAEAIVGKVAAWGVWIGMYENKWGGNE